MSKITEFYAKALEDETAKKEIAEVLGEKRFEEADDAQLLKLGEIAARLGYEITLEEAKEYFHPEEAELDEDDLDAVAGGKSHYHRFDDCTKGVGAVLVEIH